MADSTGLQFTVKVGALPEGTFVVAEFALDEALNRPFNLRLELASAQPDIDFGAVLDQPCELLVWYNGELQRRVCGVVSDFAQGDSGFRRTRYQLLVQPALWRLSLRQNSRIFQAQKPDEILSILLQEHGITDYAFALKNEHAKREYCVQYRETDLDFVNRLAAEEGMFYFHEFEAGKHRIVFADDAAALTAGPELFFNLGNRSLEQGPYVRQFHYREAVRPSDVELKDYSFKTPAYGLSHKKQGAELEHQRDTYQHFDFPGRYKADPSGKAFAQHRLDALRNDAVAGQAKSNCAALQPGQTFSLTEHPNGSLNTDWQIVRIQHTGLQPQALEEEGGSGPTVYHNEFGVVKASTTWRARIGSPEAPPQAHGGWPANRHGGGPRRGRDLLRRARSGETAVPVGPLRQLQRPKLLLGAGESGLGRRPVRHDGHPAHRPRSHRQFPGRGPGPAHRHRSHLSRHQPPALRVAGQQDPHRTAHREPPG